MTTYNLSRICELAAVTPPVVKNLIRGKVIRKKAKGTGKYITFSLDEGVKLAVCKSLLVLGIEVANLRAMFAAIDRPSLPQARPWSWLQTPDRVTQGAVLCVIYQHPLLPAGTGAIVLTTAAGADRITMATAKSIRIDVHQLISEIEHRAGVPYGARVS
jgi:hypothetical protein